MSDSVLPIIIIGLAIIASIFTFGLTRIHNRLKNPLMTGGLAILCLIFCGLFLKVGIDKAEEVQNTEDAIERDFMQVTGFFFSDVVKRSKFLPEQVTAGESVETKYRLEVEDGYLVRIYSEGVLIFEKGIKNLTQTEDNGEGRIIKEKRVIEDIDPLSEDTRYNIPQIVEDSTTWEESDDQQFINVSGAVESYIQSSYDVVDILVVLLNEDGEEVATGYDYTDEQLTLGEDWIFNVQIPVVEFSTIEVINQTTPI